MCSQSDHIRMKRPSQFPKLAYVGIQWFGSRREDAFELRNCGKCLSTLAVSLEVDRERE